MAKAPISGISGVLGELISPAMPGCQPSQIDTADAAESDATRGPGSRSQSVAGHRRARVGRPGKTAPRPNVCREKVTLRVRSDLIADYRDWSWEARCQLGELVEQALTDYRDSRRRGR